MYRLLEPSVFSCGCLSVSVCILLVVACLSTEIVAQSPRTPPKIATFSEVGHALERRNGSLVLIWRHLACITTYVYTRQNLIENVDGDYTVDDVLIVLFNVSNTMLASYFISLISQDRKYLQFISFQKGSDSSSNINLPDIPALFIKYNNKSRSVIFFSCDVNDVVAVLEAVSLSEQLRYTGLLHTTEWLIVLTVLVDDIPYVLLQWSRTVDFITLVYMPFINSTLIAQQSRVQNLTVKAKVMNYNIHPGQGICEASDWPGTPCGFVKSPKEILRKGARLFLKSQKSVMGGMRLPVAVTQTIVQRNLTNTDKHAMELLHLLASSLGFGHQLVSSNDSGFYGIVTGEATGTGISGLLARREAMLTTMPFSLTDNRLKAVNYIPVRILEEPFFIFYRWPYGSEKMDLIYIYIMKWEFIYFLSGTLLSLGIIGIIVHLATRSCSGEFTETFSASDIRLLASFLDHVTFKFPRRYVVHSGLILLACWAVFLVVWGSAYSGFLVTDFVTADAPPVKSLEQLNSNKDFPVGVHGLSDVTVYLLNHSNDTVLQTFLARLRELNASDAETFSTISKVHTDKMAAGGYAYMGSACVPLGLCEEIPEKIKSLVFFPVEDRKLYVESFVAVIKEAFFQRDLYHFLLRVEQLGILDFLRKKYLSSKLVNDAFAPLKKTIYQKDSENTRVEFVRILFVVYLGLIGIGVGVVCLFVELVVYRLRVRNTVSIQ